MKHNNLKIFINSYRTRLTQLLKAHYTYYLQKKNEILRSKIALVKKYYYYIIRSHILYLILEKFK